MKNISRISFIAAAVFATASMMGALTATDHIPRDGDRLHTGLDDSRSLILSISDSARTVMLNPEAVSFDNDRDAYFYIDGDTISYIQSATKHRFILRGDTVSYIGYENRASDFRLDRPIRVTAFPLDDNVSIKDLWSAHLLHYGSMALRHVRGISRTSIKYGWTLTDGTDSLRNATRLLWSLDMAYADTDSFTASMPDSVVSEKISEMQVDVKAVLSERLLTERAMWFADGTRYPVLTESRVSRIMLNDGFSADTVPVSMLAMYYPASWQYSDNGEEIITQNQRKDDGGYSYDQYDDNDQYDDKSTDNGTALFVGEAELSGNFVRFLLSSRYGTIDATITLFSDSGLRLTDPRNVKVGTVPQSYSVEAPSGWNGVMLLRVDTGEESYTRKIIR